MEGAGARCTVPSSVFHGDLVLGCVYGMGSD